MSSHQRAVAGRAIVFLAVLLTGSVLASCHDPQLQLHSLSTAAAARMQAFLVTELKWTNWHIFEQGDDQSLDHGGNYGPLVKLYANPDLATLSQADYRDTGIIAAVTFIDPAHADLPRGYDQLGLKPDFTCIIMRWTDAGQWEAYSVKSDARTCRTSETRVPLNVKLLTPSANPAEYPPVARFHITRDRRNAIGVRCLVGWCILGLRDSDSEEESEHLTDGSGRATYQQRIPGWYDYQRIAVTKWSVDWDWFPVARRLKPVMRASVIPQPGLGDWLEAQFESDTGLHVAQIFVRGSLEEKYRSLGVRPGWTRMYLRKHAATGAWHARYIAGGDTSRWYKVVRTDHHADVPLGTRIPGLARWRWLETDEEIWVACDVGCCRVTHDPM